MGDMRKANRFISEPQATFIPEYECRQDGACAFGSHSVECEDQNRAALRAAAEAERGER